MLSSELFSRSGRLSRLLRFVVEQTLEGKRDELKEYLLGVEVFDKGVGFDPRTDTIVRVEARRLRLKLISYYAGEGKRDPILIEFARGSYAPTIRSAPAAEPPPEGPRARAGVAIRRRLVAASLWALPLGVLGYVVYRFHDSSPAPAARRPVLALMPFLSLSGDAVTDEFTRGLEDEVSGAMDEVSGLTVLQTLGREGGPGSTLGVGRGQAGAAVDALLEVSVRRIEGKVRVAARCLGGSDGKYLWSEVFERELKDVFQVQEEIAGRIAQNLEGLAQASELGRGRYAAPFEAQFLYVRGRNCLGSRRILGGCRSVDLFEQALAVDPRYGLAYCGLADAWIARGLEGRAAIPEAFARAREAAAKALELDNSLGEAHAALGHILYLYDWKWREAERELDQAVALSPSFADAYRRRGILRLVRRDFERASSDLERAEQLDPLSPRMPATAAYAHILAGHAKKAEECAGRALKLDPRYPMAQAMKGEAHRLQGRRREALEELHESVRNAPTPDHLMRLGRALAEAGKREQAAAILSRIEHSSARTAPRSYARAVLEACLGNAEEALARLEEACRNREPELVYLGVEPSLEKLRENPRFQTVARRVGI